MEMLRTVGCSPSTRSLSIAASSGRYFRHRYERTTDQSCLPRGLSSFERANASLEDVGEPLSQFLSAALLNTSIFVDASYASESAASNSATGSEVLMNAAGAGYILLVAYFLFRLLNKRAKRFTKQRLAGSEQTEDQDATEDDDAQNEMTLADGLAGILQSGALAAGLFFFTTKVDTALLAADLPDQYTAHNIAVTVRTIIRGFCYLLTFIFTMNCIGLTGLTVKLAIDPESVNAAPISQPKDTETELPKISVVSDPEDVARAFDEVSKRASSEE